jgi:hypothetical protein
LAAQVALPVPDDVVAPLGDGLGEGEWLAAGVALGVVAGVVGAVSGRTRASLGAADVAAALCPAVADGPAEPVADEDGVAEEDPDGDALDEPGFVATPFRHEATTAGITLPRMVSTAALPRAATAWALVCPGMDTTIWLLPWTTTVDWVTPVPLTRFSMIVLAWLIAEEDGVFPFGVLAVKITCVPPTRSRPSLGVCRVPGQNTIP